VDCRESRELMSGAVDNRLLREDSRNFYDHIEICGSCRDEYELEKLTKAYIKRKITFVEVPYDLERAIVAQFSIEARQERKLGFFSKLFGNGMFQPFLAVGIVAVIGIILFFANKPNVILPTLKGSTETVQAAQQDAFSLAETNFQNILSGKFTPQVTAVASSDVASFIDRNAGYSVQLPSVATADWVGGMVSDYGGNKMVQVVYKIGEEYIYICSFAKSVVNSKKIVFPSDCTKAMEAAGWFWGQDSNGDTQAAWSSDDHVCIATSNLEKNELVAYLNFSVNGGNPTTKP